MSTVLDDPITGPATTPAQRLRTTMAAVRVSLSWLGVRKTLTPEQKNQAADTFGAAGDYLSVGKKLLDTRHPSFKAVTAVKNNAVGFWKSLTLPFPEGGVRLIRQDRVEQFDTQMREFQAELTEAVATLDRHYAELKSAARDRLGTLFNESDYPASLEGMFSITWDFPSVEPPEYLQQLNPELYQQECERVQQRFDEAVRLAEEAFIAELAKLVSHLTERLSGQVDGKPKIFRDSARLLKALHDAMLTTDPDAVRYATDHIQVRGGSGALAATDGRQMLIQDGFEFPWDDDVLIPRTKVFGSKELPQDEPVAIGKTDDWVAVRVGPWTIWLKIEKERRFPEVDHHVPRAQDAASGCRLSAADAEFLTDNLPRLPCDEEYNFPVTLDLNGSVAIRAKAADQPQPTELVLCDSQASGEPMRINMNRRFLARAAKLGLNELCLYSPKVPAMCHDDGRRYVWALLNPESAIPPTDDVIRITSADAGQDALTTNRKPRERKAIMSRSTFNGNGQGKANGRTPAQATTSAKSDDQGFEFLIEQAEAVKVSLRDSLSKTGELISALKRHRKQSKAVATTLASLRRLQSVGA